MSYRSDVGFAMSENQYQKMLKTAQKELSEEPLQRFNDLLNNADYTKVRDSWLLKVIREEDDDSQSIHVVKILDIKWYCYEKGFEEITFIDNYLKQADFSYDYVILGEELQDNQLVINLGILGAKKELVVYN